MTQVSHLSIQTLNDQSRVLIISDAAPHRNGVGAYYADLVDDLNGYVGHVEIISPEIIGEKWHGGWSLPLPGDKTQKLCLPNAFELQKQIRLYQPTVIVIPTPGLFGLLGAILAKRMGLPVIIGFHTWFEKLAGLYWNRVQGGLTKTYFELANKALFRLADRVLANSKEMVDIAHENGAPNAGLMGTPLSQSLLDAPVEPAPKQLRSVLFIGRLAAEKNIETILDAARDNTSIRFTIAGEGPERAKIERLASGLANVSLVGWVDRTRLITLIDEHDALVLPSKVESFGTVAMEAMVRQRLVIVSKACGITEWPALRTGLLVIEEDSSLSQKLRQASELSEFELFGRCTIARRVVLEHVNWNRDLWLDCLKSNAKARIVEDAEAESLWLRLAKTVWR